MRLGRGKCEKRVTILKARLRAQDRGARVLFNPLFITMETFYILKGKE